MALHLVCEGTSQRMDFAAFDSTKAPGEVDALVPALRQRSGFLPRRPTHHLVQTGLLVQRAGRQRCQLARIGGDTDHPVRSSAMHAAWVAPRSSVLSTLSRTPRV